MDLTRTDASQNVHRFYRMEIVPGLSGEWSLVREWGRIGQLGQVRCGWYSLGQQVALADDQGLVQNQA